MTTRISIELLQNLVIKSAQLVGPEAVKFIKCLKESQMLIDVDWEILAHFLTSSLHPSQIENICFRAMTSGIIDMSKLAPLIQKVEKEKI